MHKEGGGGEGTVYDDPIMQILASTAKTSNFKPVRSAGFHTDRCDSLWLPRQVVCTSDLYPPPQCARTATDPKVGSKRRCNAHPRCLDKAVCVRNTRDSKARAGLDPYTKQWYNGQATLQIIPFFLFTVGGIGCRGRGIV